MKRRAHATERLQVAMSQILFHRFKSEIKVKKKRETGPESVRVKGSITYLLIIISMITNKDGESKLDSNHAWKHVKVKVPRTTYLYR